MENSVKKFSELIGSLEQISEDQQGMLIGGFAMISGASMDEFTKGFNVSCDTNTNCAGGNCVSGCGKDTPSTQFA